MADIEISYKNSSIASSSSSGTITLDTAGTYCEDDITIQYTRPSVPVVIEADEKDVNFYDYDGTRLYSYTASEFANLSELPANPTHSGLTAEGWNWSLADAKAQVLKSKYLEIGQMYKTSDGKTRLYISVTDLALAVKVCWNQSVASSVTIDWGDGTTMAAKTGTGNKNATHTYAAAGDYIITYTVSSGTLSIGNSSTGSRAISDNAQRHILKKAEIGSGVVLTDGCFYTQFALETITLPKTLTTLGASMFASCYSLKFLVVPNQVTSFGKTAFRYCYSAKGFCIPKSLTSFGPVNDTDATFGNWQASRTRIIVAGNVTNLPNSVFYNCTSAQVVWLPSTLATIEASACGGMGGLCELHFTSATPPVVSNSNAFVSLPATCKIFVPTGKLSAYTSASNYPSSATYTYVEE